MKAGRGLGARALASALALLLGGGPATALNIEGARIASALAGAAPVDQVPLEFAVPIELDLPLHAQDGELRLPIHSPGATSISLELRAGALPADSRLWLESPDGALRHGPYGPAQFADGTLFTPLIPGDRARLRLEADGAARLRLLRLFHGYRDFFSLRSAKDLGDSGSCNIDVACPQAGAWRSDAASVARLQIGGTRLCSGVLVNNLRQDLRPYVLTADHCQIGNAVTDASPNSVVFYWNLRNRQCGGDSRQADISQTTTGARFVADDVESDFTLLELNQRPPALYDLYYAGFDANSAAPQDGAAIHHPSGDTQKISFYRSAQPDRVNIGGGRTVSAWRVTWAEGTTEPGSSGGGLWNQQHRLVGLLSGGSASCQARNDPDYFGRLDVAWEAGSARHNQLRAHLNPDGTCDKAVDGRRANLGPGSPASGSACGGPATSGGGALSLWLLALGMGVGRWKRQMAAAPPAAAGTRR